MNITRKYKVAGLVFSLNLPDSQKLWDSLSEQYGPFEIGGSEGGEPLFSLEFSTERPSLGDAECIYDLPTEEGETVVKMYHGSAGWFFETAPDKSRPFSSLTHCSEDFSKAEIFLETRLLRDANFAINNAAMLLFSFAGAPKGILELHSSVIENGGKAYMFLGKSGTGKSTHSSMWMKYIPGCTLVNDDNPALRVMEDGRVMIYGSPWSGKTRCYKNLEYPAGAFVQIRQCPENKIRRLSVLEAFSSLYSSVSGLKSDDAAMFDDINSSMDKVISTVPFYLLDCRPDEEAAKVCHKAVTA